LITLSDEGCLNKELEDPNFIVYPNPTTEQVKVNYKGTDFSNTVTLNIYDLLGRQIIQKDLSQERNGNFQAIIDVSKYQTGSYVLSITDGQKKLGRVIVKAE
jgi:Secretion system C-terminal sorting domain